MSGTGARTRNGAGTIASLLGAAAPIGLALLSKVAPIPAAATIPAPQGQPTLAPPQPVAALAAGKSPLPDPQSAACLTRFAAVGIPAERDMAGRTIVCRRGYVLAFDASSRDPDWVMEHLAPADLAGTADRSNAFQHDPNLPAGADAANADYEKSGYDRGHQAPAGDAKFSQAVMDQSFYFSNMAPQIGIGFNRGAWKYLEESVRAWVTCGGHPDLYVITGPVYPAGTNPKAIGADKVIVPTSFYKIVYDAGSQRAVGFLLPNKAIGSKIANLQDYVKPIADIEGVTGLTFFPALETRLRTRIKAQAATAWGHIADCPAEGAS